MDNIRIGNDISIVWSLYDVEGTPYQLEGRQFFVILCVAGRQIPVTEYSIVDNELHLRYRGKEQQYLGRYDLKYVENAGSDDMVTYDVRNAFELVPHSWLESGGEEQSGIEVQSIEIESRFSFIDLSDYAKKEYVDAAVATKQDTIEDLAEIRDGAAKGATAIQEHQSLKTINGESVKGTGNINTDAIQIQHSPRLVAAGDVFDEYFGVSAYDLLKRGICGYFDAQESFNFIYYKVSGTFPLEDTGIGPTVVFDDGTTRSTITTWDEEGTIYIDALSEEPSKVELQQSLTPGSSTKAPSVNAVKNRIEPIEAKIPAEASSSNKLADKAYVDGKVAVVDEKVGDIEDIIPDQASALNKLADKNYVHSEVQQFAADYRGIYVNLRQIPTDTRYYPSDDEGNQIPNRNDYLVVDDVEVSVYQWVSGHSYAVGDIVYDYDEWPCMFICKSAVSGSTHPEQDEDHWELWFYCDLSVDGSIIEGSWLFTYTGSWETKGILGWLPRYQINEAPFTADQWAAINSGMNTTKRQKLDALPTNAELQQSLEDLTPLVLTYGTSYGEETYNALEAIATGITNRKAFIKWGNSIYPASVEDYGAVYGVVAILVGDAVLSTGLYKLSCVIAAWEDEYNTDWSYENAEKQEVFVATYGQTSFQDVYDNAQNRQVVAVEGNSRYLLQSIDSNAAYFFGVTNEWSYVVQLLASGVWRHMADYKQERQSNKLTTDPTAADLDSTTKYPAMVVMKNYINSQLQGALDESYPRAIAQINALYPED